MKYFISNTTIYRIHQNEDGTLTMYREYKYAKSRWTADGSEYPDAGMFINQQGGIAEVLSKCKEIDNIQEYVNELNAEKEKQQNKAMQEQEERLRAIRDAYAQTFSGEVTETTPETIGILLRYLNTQNWGTWNLPKMSIGYKCLQFDCAGTTATAMRLDTPIEYDGEMVTTFKYGAPHGHLTKYTTIR